MKILLFALSIPLAVFDIFLISSFPWKVVYEVLGAVYTLLLGIGVAIYMTLHALRKPVNFYLWNHELSHLVFAKLFFRKISLFQISHKRGGKVGLDKTNVIIDLAPYYFSPFGVGLVLLALLFDRAGFEKAIPLYSLGLGWVLAMTGAFTVEALIYGQEDMKRNGLLFSITLITALFALSTPLYLLPYFDAPLARVGSLYSLWLKKFLINARSACSLIKSFARTIP